MRTIIQVRQEPQEMNLYIMKRILFILFLSFSIFGAVKYVDFSQPSDTIEANPPRYWHTGDSDDPFNHRNLRDWVGPDNAGVGKYYNGTSWQTGINTQTDTFLMKGQISAPTGAFTYNNPFIRTHSKQFFKPWDPQENGPYRISNYYTNGFYVEGNWTGGYIQVTLGNIAFGDSCVMNTMMVICSSGVFSIGSGNKFYGCTMYSPGGMYVNDSTNIFVNTILSIPGGIHHCGSNFRLNAWNCVFDKSKAFLGSCGINVKDTNNQFSWGNIKYVRYDSPKDSFNSSILLINVNLPPRPGKTPYTDHTTDLFGNTRYDIGANYQKSPNVSWTSPVIDTFNTAVSHEMTILSGPVDSVKLIDGELPSGLSLNKLTGLISGTPSKVTFRNDYGLRVYNSQGTYDFYIRITIIPKGPKRHYVDLSQLTDKSIGNPDTVRYKHTGEVDDPFNYRNFKLMISQVDSTSGHYYDNGWHEAYTDFDTFFIKGSFNNKDSLSLYGSPCFNPFLYTSKSGQVFLPWSPAVNGPYRIYMGMSNYHGTWKGGYIYNPGNLYGTFYTMLLGGSYPIGGDSMTSMHFLDGMKLYGCTIECNEVWYHNDGTDTFPYIQDCIMRHRETSGPIPPKYLHFDTKNSAYAMSHLLMRNNGVWPDSGKIDDSLSCQWGDSTMIVPGWNAPKDSFKLSMALNGVLTPPQPGNAPYTGYETDLFGVKRKNIGANWQPSTSHIWVAEDSLTNFLWSNNLNWSNWMIPGSLDTVVFSSSGGTISPAMPSVLSIGQITRSINFGTRNLILPSNKLSINNGGIVIYDNGFNGLLSMPDTLVLNGPNDSIIIDPSTAIPIMDKPYVLIAIGANSYINIDNFFWTHTIINSGTTLTCTKINGLGGTAGSPDSLIGAGAGATLDLTGNQTVTWADPVYVKDMALAAGDTVTLTTGIDGGGNTGAWIFPSSATNRRNRGWLGLGVWIMP